MTRIETKQSRRLAAEKSVLRHAKKSLKAFYILHPEGRKTRKTINTELVEQFPTYNQYQIDALIKDAHKTNPKRLKFLENIVKKSTSKFSNPKKTPPKYNEIDPWFKYFSKSHILSVLGIKSETEVKSGKSGKSGSFIDETAVKLIGDEWCSKLDNEWCADTKVDIIDTIFNGESLDLDQFFDLDDSELDEETQSITLPLINKTAKFEVRKEIKSAVENYETMNANGKKVESVADVPIYFVLVIGAERELHTSLLILIHNNVKTQMYSIGLGYYGQTLKDSKLNATTGVLQVNHVLHSGNGALYSPDFLIQPRPDLKNRIVDIGILTSKHIESLNDKFIKHGKSLVSNIKKIPSTENAYGDIIPGSFVSPTSTLEIDIRYFGLANKWTYWDNCTSFITKIFPNIDCNFGPVVKPGKCNTSPKTTSAKINKAYRFYMDSSAKHNMTQPLIQLLTMPEKRSGGKRRSCGYRRRSYRGCR